jgi:glycosyltransferase involved in cell wall biosynthesis
MNNDVLVTVSGTIDPLVEIQIANGERPLADYIALERAFGADLLDYPKARQLGGSAGRLFDKAGGPNLALAWACYVLRRRYRVIFTDGEQVGLPLAGLLKIGGFGPRPRHLMIAHILSVRKKLALLDTLRLYTHIDTFFTYSTYQKDFIQQRWKLMDGQVVFTPFMVDANFFSPMEAELAGKNGGMMRSLAGIPLEDGRPLISAVGLEFRDYPTLLAAVDGLDVTVVIAAASPWSKHSNSATGRTIPDNVIVRKFSQYDLRQLYAASRFVAVPLYPVAFQAGVTTILEAMAMQRAVIVTRTQGQTDVVVEGETGLYVAPQSPEDLRKAICYLLAHPKQADRLGAQGRLRVLEEMSLDLYTSRLKRYVV